MEQPCAFASTASVPSGQNVGVNDGEVRSALRARLDRQYPDRQGTRIVEELDLCQASARIDLAVVNGRMIGWEIKSGADRLGRLPQQQVVYSRLRPSLASG